jgi:hypothetical protein
VTSSASNVLVTATSTPLLVSIGAAGSGSSGASGIAGAGTLTINSIANAVDAHINSSTVAATLGDVIVTARETASMYVVALAGAGAPTGSAIGASIAYNYLGGTIDNNVRGGTTPDPNVITFLNGTDDMTSPSVTDKDTTVRSSVSSYINDSSVTARGRVMVLSGFDDPTKQSDLGPLVGGTWAVNPATAVTLTNGTVQFSADHGFITGQEVLYSNGGGTSIGGLTSGKTYYAIYVDSVRIKLAKTQEDAFAGIAISLTSTGSGNGHSFTPLNADSRAAIDPSSTTIDSNQVKFSSAHYFVDDEPVVYHSGDDSNTAITGLTDGQVYYINYIDAKTFTLSSTANGTVLTLSGGSGTGHSFTGLTSTSAKSFNAGASAVNVSTTNSDTIVFAGDHHLNTGDAVVYKNGGGTSIGGLTEGETFYVVKVDAKNIRLAATLNDALATTPKVIFLTSAGTGTTHSLIGKPSTVTAGSLSIALPVPISTQLVSVVAAGAGGQGNGYAGAVSLNFVRMSVDAHISNVAGTKKVEASGGISVLATDTSKIGAGTGTIAISTTSGKAIGASVGVNDIRNTITGLR